MGEKLKPENIMELGRETRIRELAKKLQNRYNINDRLDLAEDQSELFNLYLMGYLTLSTDVATSDLLKRPDIEALSKMPLFRGMVSFMERREQRKRELADRYFDEASVTALRIRGVVTKTALEVVAEKGNLTIEEINGRLDSNSRPILDSMVDLLLGKIGSPRAIRNAANLVCSTYRYVENKDLVEQDKTMERVLNRIKIKKEI